VSTDVPHLDCVYKLQVYEGRPTRKRSMGKSTWPGCKQVYRSWSQQGSLERDVVALAEDEPPAGEPLLAPVMRAGRRISDSPSLADIRSHAARELERLPPALRALTPERVEWVTIAESVRRLAAEVDEEVDRCPEAVARS
jgi:nicotinate phosphoribosyltransferase